MHLEYIKDESLPGFGYFDLVFDKDQTTDQYLKDAVILSLFTWDRSETAIDDENYGWWSRPLGSLLWIVKRAKITEGLLPRIETIIKDCLQWLIDEQIADFITVNVRSDKENPQIVGAEITISKDKNNFVVKFVDLWKGI